ncbi:MAG: hypothetical protein MAG431_00498 [Chloroflexi bacterium]|nr:hypothetical protein [Chloroflexota bacterium]
MAKNNCPMCGKPNPEDREVCQFCEARLKPLVDSPAGDEDTSSLSPGSAPSPMDTGELERTLPVWLQDARGTTSPEEPSPDSSQEEDWLAKFQDSPDSKKAEPPPITEEGDQDWLQRIRALEAEEKNSEKSAVEKSIPEEKAVAPGSETVSGDDLPDWLLEMEGEETGEELETPQASPEEEAPMETTASPFGEDAEETSFDDDEALDWLDEEAGEDDPEGAVPGEDLPDWLLEMKGEETGEELETPQASPEEEVPMETTASPFEEDAEETSFDDDEALDWLDEEAGEDDPEGAVPGEDLPDWLLEMKGEETGREPETPDTTSVEEDLEESASPFGEDVAEGLLDEETDLDWLDEGESPEEEMPDWLLEEKASEDVEHPSEDEESVFISPFSEEKKGEIAGEDIFADDLPQWLSEASDEELAEEGLSGKDLDDITPGELPGWVEAMRPVKAPSEEDSELLDEEEYVESSGPLAGMENILPAEAGIIKAHKAAKQSFKLKVAESQQQYVNLLETMVANEEKTEAAPAQPLISTQRVLRWLIALVLFLSIGFAFSSTQEWFSYPFHQEETRSINEAIQALPEASPVLVAFDYEPALSGEMNAIAAGVIDHLMLRGTYLTFVSTSPTGPVLVENFLRTTQAQHKYIHGQQYVNLGYIPGGAAGLLSFVVSPQNIMPLAFDGADAWKMQPLQEIKSIADFSLVLVITDDADTARIWVEQVQPNLTSTPLMMAVSAQAEPLVRPYYEATPQQVAGLVAGLPGGTSYEQLIGRGGLAQGYWNAFSIGIIAAGVVLLISGVANVVLSQIDNKRKYTEVGK